MSIDEPTLPERRQAEVLARWLEGATDGIPDDLDEDVVEAVLALRPELAAAPTLSADDILAGVQSGPLAVPDLQTVPEIEQAPGTAEGPSAGSSLGQPAPLPAPANRPPWVGWAITAAGGLAAVAAAALIFMSSTLTLQGPPSDSMAQLDKEEELPADRAPAPAPADIAGDSGRDAEKPDAASTRETEIQLDAPAPPDESRERMARADGASGTKALDGLEGMDGETLGGLGLSGSGRGGGGSSEGGIGSVSGLGSASGSGSSYGAGPGAATPADESLDDAVDMDDAVAMEEEEAFESEPEVEVDELVILRGATTSGDELDAPSAVETASTANRSLGRDAPRTRRKEAKAEADAAAPAPVEPAPDLDSLERQARPSSPPAAETQAIVDLLDAGQARDARDSARSLLSGSSLSALRRADLQWALGRAQLALGERRAAEMAFREAIRLRGR